MRVPISSDMFGNPFYRVPVSPGYSDDVMDYDDLYGSAPYGGYASPYEQAVLRQQQARQQQERLRRQREEAMYRRAMEEEMLRRKQREEAVRQQQEKLRDQREQQKQTQTARRNLFAEQLKKRAEEEERLKAEEERRKLEAEEKERLAAEERQKWLEHASKPEVREKAATTLASTWRGHVVRQAAVPKKLGELRKVQQKVAAMREQYEPRLAGPFSGNFEDRPTKALLKDALAYDEELTRVLLSLDSISSGRNPIVREYRKTIVDSVSGMLERLEPVKRQLQQRSRAEDEERRRREEAEAAAAAAAAAAEAAAKAAAAAEAAAKAAAEARAALPEQQHQQRQQQQQTLSPPPAQQRQESESADGQRDAAVSEADSSQMAVEPTPDAGAATLSDATPAAPEQPQAEPMPVEPSSEAVAPVAVGQSASQDWAVIEPDERSGPHPTADASDSPSFSMDVEPADQRPSTNADEPYANLRELSFDDIRRMLLQKDAYIRELESRVSALQANADIAE